MNNPIYHIMKVTKRDGRSVDFDLDRIATAINAASKACGVPVPAYKLANDVLYVLKDKDTTVEDIQDVVEKVLMQGGYDAVAKAYILYRQKRSDVRESKGRMVQTMFDLTFQDSFNSDLQRENANIDADSSMGTMLKYGSENAKNFNLLKLVRPEHAKAHKDGLIHIHDLDFYALTTTCTQINLTDLFERGFHTGHGFIRTPNSIGAYASLACIVIQANQNDQHGGQSIPMFEYDMAKGVSKSFRNKFCEYFSILSCGGKAETEEVKEYLTARIKDGKSVLSDDCKAELCSLLQKSDVSYKCTESVFTKALKATERETYQAMEALMHNLNTMSSRAGAQVPFSSINYGTGTTPECRMVIKQCLLALDAGLGNGETSIFPVHIFKCKKGVNYNKTDPNYDLFKLACKVSAKRLFPNFSFLDAPFNLQYYKAGKPDTEVGVMGCRTRVMANAYDRTRETTSGRGNLSFTTINLPRIAIEARGNSGAFIEGVGNACKMVFAQLLERFEVQAERRKLNYPFLMGQGVWKDSEKLGDTDTVREVLKHGTLTVGFIGLAEAMIALFGRHHGEDETVRTFAHDVISYMRDLCDKKTAEKGMNFTLIATPAEGLSGRFVRLDRKKYGVIEGVTDRDYYTNSFHVPVYFPISIFKKIDIEAPYHALCNGGHISYIELDGDPSKNVEAFEQIIRYMCDKNIGYGSINHAVDYDPVCGYTGIIGDVCPRCGRREGEPITAEKMAEIRRKRGK